MRPAGSMLPASRPAISFSAARETYFAAGSSRTILSAGPTCWCGLLATIAVDADRAAQDRITGARPARQQAAGLDLLVEAPSAHEASSFWILPTAVSVFSP